MMIDTHSNKYFCEILSSIDSLSEERLQELLFHLEVHSLARFLKRKFPDDPRSIDQLIDLILEELCDGDTSHKTYVKVAYDPRTKAAEEEKRKT